MNGRIVCATLFLGLGMSAPAAAQSFGLKGGLNLMTQAVSPADGLGEVKAEIGGAVGGYLTFREADRLSVEVAAQWSMRRTSFDADIVDTITYVEVPVVVRYPLVKRARLTLRAIGGGVVAFRLKASESVFGTSSSVTEAYRPVDVAVVAGAQAQLNERWLVQGHYQFGLSDVYDVTIGGLKVRQRGLQILVGYKLR